jgi:ectoine hydroxylase-related dioxygenase (phytanoyl-CoA dioxygenase family)
VIARDVFEREGFVAGIPALAADELALYRPKLLALYEALPEALHKHFINLHGVLDWAAALGRHPAILDAVEALTGPDILLWKSKAFVKFPGPAQVAWHQALPHWNLVPAEAVTAWLALSDSGEANGCVRAIPASHRAGSRASRAISDPNSLLTAGLEFNIAAAEAQRAVPMLLRAGEFSIHHGMTVHGSGENRTNAPRLGIAFVYMPAHVRQASAPDRHVVLARGQDRARYFPADPPPAGAEAAQLAAAGDYFARLKSGEIPYNVR